MFGNYLGRLGYIGFFNPAKGDFVPNKNAKNLPKDGSSVFWPIDTKLIIPGELGDELALQYVPNTSDPLNYRLFNYQIHSSLPFMNSKTELAGRLLLSPNVKTLPFETKTLLIENESSEGLLVRRLIE